MYSQLNAAQRGKSERRVSGTYAHEGVRSDVAMRASGVLWGPCHNSRGPEPLWKRAEDHRHLTGLRTEAGMFLCNHHRKHDSAGNREERREKMLCVFVLPRCDVTPRLLHVSLNPPCAPCPKPHLRSSCPWSRAHTTRGRRRRMQRALRISDRLSRLTARSAKERIAPQ